MINNEDNDEYYLAWGGVKHYYVIFNYTKDQKNQDIKDEDVVRPANHRYAMKNSAETDSWSKKSRRSCPTYGSCTRCWNCGPMGQVCKSCYRRTGLEKETFIMIQYEEKIIDSIALTAIFKRFQEKAKANRTVGFNLDVLHLTDRHFYVMTTLMELRREITSCEGYFIREGLKKLLK
jgi:hypothetical protein